MSFRSDVSMPERNLEDPNPPHSGRRSEPGPVAAQIADRDRRVLTSALRNYGLVYGVAALHELIDAARAEAC